MIAGNETASDALHNMSAPPRMQLSVRPLRSAEGSGSTAGTTLIGILDIEAFGESSSPMVGLARLALRASGGSFSGELEFFLDEDLGDLIIQEAARLDPSTLGLPAFAMLRPAGRNPEGPPIDDPAIAVALMTRMSGRLFIARRSPHLPELRKIRHPLAVHTMERK